MSIRLCSIIRKLNLPFLALTGTLIKSSAWARNACDIDIMDIVRYYLICEYCRQQYGELNVTGENETLADKLGSYTEAQLIGRDPRIGIIVNQRDAALASAGAWKAMATDRETQLWNVAKERDALQSSLDEMRELSGKAERAPTETKGDAALLEDLCNAEFEGDAVVAGGVPEVYEADLGGNFSEQVVTLDDHQAHVTRLQAEVEWFKRAGETKNRAIQGLAKERDDLQQRLTVSGQRNAELVKAATEFMEYAESGWDHFPDVGVNLRAAIKATESGASE